MSVTHNPERYQQGGESLIEHREPVVSVGALLEFLRAQDAAVTDAVEGLRGQRPGHLSSAAETTRHAGELGIQAGKRQVLNALAEVVRGVLPVTDLSSPDETPRHKA